MGVRIVCAAMIAATSIANADGTQAEQLFEQGREAAKAGDFDVACKRFEESWALVAAPGTALNLADCYLRRGELARAYRMFVTTAESFERAGSTSRAQFARKQADDLLPKLGTIDVDVADATLAGLEVVVGQHVIASAAHSSELVDPGHVEVIATAPGRARFAQHVDVAAGGHAAVQIALVAMAPPPPPRRIQHHGTGHYLTIGFAAGGGVLFSASVAVSWYAKSRYDELACTPERPCFPSRINAANHWVDVAATWGTGLAVAGGAALATSLVLYFALPRDPVLIVPAASSDSVGLTATGRF